MAAIAQTIEELTGQQFRELSFNTAAPAGLINGAFIESVCIMLNKCGIDISPVSIFNQAVEIAVKNFQIAMGLTPTGIITNAVWKLMIQTASALNDTIEDDTEEEEDDTVSTTTSDSPHFNSFFSDSNYKQARKNRQDIKIVFGNKTITKTIKDVFMRSVNVEVDTSGEPISEVYEFIARDVTESDELNDAAKYLTPEDYAAPDIQYKYEFGETLDN